MEQLIDKLLNMGMEQFMDHSRQEFIMTDKVYVKDREDEGELEQRYMGLDLPDEKRNLIILPAQSLVKAAMRIFPTWLALRTR